MTYNTSDDGLLFKISKVKDCKLKRVGELPFEFHGSACNSFPFGIMLCFDYMTDAQECHS